MPLLRHELFISSLTLRLTTGDQGQRQLDLGLPPDPVSKALFLPLPSELTAAPSRLTSFLSHI